MFYRRLLYGRGDDPMRVLREYNPAFFADARQGITSSAERISQWNDISGNARHLTQGTEANQPIYLRDTGTNYLYLPAAASNTVTTPNKSITGNKTLTFDVTLADYTPAADVTLIDKSSGNDGFIVKWLTTDIIRFVVGDGASLTNVDCDTASGLTNFTRHTVQIIWTDGVGASFKVDGAALGGAVAAVKTLTNAAVVLTIGSATSSGRVYDVLLTNSSTTTHYHMDADESAETTTNGATWVSSNGETYTLNNSGATPAQIVGSAQVLFGGSHWMATAAFDLPQPCVLYAVLNSTGWANNKIIFDGTVASSRQLFTEDPSPTVKIYAGTALGTTNLVLQTPSIVSSLVNGASSSIQVNLTTATTGNAGTASGLNNGIVFGAGPGGTVPATFQAMALIAFSANAIQTRIIRALGQIYGIAV